MHVIAGFESQVAARGGALALAESPTEPRLEVDGVALVRRDTARGIHVDPLPGYSMPVHVLRAVDAVVDGEPGSPSLGIAETALVVAVRESTRAHEAASACRATLEGRGALWVTVV